MNKTSIAWTDYSVNPLKMRLPDGLLVNVCIHVSEGCRDCYAEALVKRWWQKDKYGPFPGYTAALLKLGKPVIVQKDLQAVVKLDEAIRDGHQPANENKVFWNDMTDEFLDYWPDELLDQCWAVRALTPHLIHQVLTKRIDRAYLYLGKNPVGGLSWPLPNVHLGVSAERQIELDERVRLLLETPAAVRWVSAEPLLGPLNLNAYLNTKFLDSGCYAATTQLDWVVAGGKSGSHYASQAIPDEARWIEDIVDQCRASNVPAFVKQDSALRPGQQGRIPDHYWIQQFPITHAQS